jgi:hypothetical protein
LAELGHHSIGKSRLSVICNQHPFILIAVWITKITAIRCHRCTYIHVHVCPAWKASVAWIRLRGEPSNAWCQCWTTVDAGPGHHSAPHSAKWILTMKLWKLLHGLACICSNFIQIACTIPATIC